MSSKNICVNSGCHAHKSTAKAILSHSALRGATCWLCKGVWLFSQLQWPTPNCRDCRVGSYNITVLNSYNCLFIVDGQWRMAGQPTQPAKYNIYLYTYYIDCHVITSLCY